MSPPQYNFQTYLPNRIWLNGTFIYVGPQYITPNILWGLIVGGFLLIILWCGAGLSHEHPAAAQDELRAARAGEGVLRSGRPLYGPPVRGVGGERL